jgi:hypothetical protein
MEQKWMRPSKKSASRKACFNVKLQKKKYLFTFCFLNSFTSVLSLQFYDYYKTIALLKYDIESLIRQSTN